MISLLVALMHSGKTQNLGFLEVFKQFTAAKFEPMNELVIANSLLRAEFDFEQDFTRSRDYQDRSSSLVF